MQEIKCPYCEKNIEIDHDEGYGYEEDVVHQQTCHLCDNTFTYITYIIYHYYPEKAECLNDGEHDFKLTQTYPRCCAKMRCSMCDEEREPTPDEKMKFKIPSWDEYVKSLNNKTLTV